MPVGDQPLVSVVIPAWNVEATLRDTLASVAGQTYRNIEIIIIDDGSTDATADVAEEFCRRADNAKLVKQGNRGPAGARNRGIAEARAEWIALLDADDLWHPTKIEKQVATALATSIAPGFVYCWYRRIDEQGLIFDSGPRWAIDGRAFGALAYLHFIRGGSSLLVRKSAIEEVGGFDESFREGCEDVVLELEIARRHLIAVVPEYLFGYRARQGSFTRDFDLLLRGWKRAFARIQGGGRVPRKVARWVNGQSDFAVARQRAIEGRARASAAALIRAFARDPFRSALALTETAAGFLLRPFRKRAPATERPHFYDVGTAEPVNSGSAAVRKIAALGDALDLKRMRALSAPGPDEGVSAR